MKRKLVQAGDEGRQPPTLIVLTGASHTGKTSVARAILTLAPAPIAFLSVDRVLEGELRPRGDIWESIPLAYELLHPQVETLLDRGWLVIYESTFTYVPQVGDPEFHDHTLSRLVAACTRTGARLLIVQLNVDEPIARARREKTQRLSATVVARTAALHREARMPEGTLRLDAGAASPEDLAREILNQIGLPCAA